MCTGVRIPEHENLNEHIGTAIMSFCWQYRAHNCFFMAATMKRKFTLPYSKTALIAFRRETDFICN